MTIRLFIDTGAEKHLERRLCASTSNKWGRQFDYVLIENLPGSVDILNFWRLPFVPPFPGDGEAYPWWSTSYGCPGNTNGHLIFKEMAKTMAA